MAFFTSDNYMCKSTEAQKRVQAAIDCLALRVQVDTRIAVEEVQKRCEMLPNMNKSLTSSEHSIKRTWASLIRCSDTLRSRVRTKSTKTRRKAIWRTTTFPPTKFQNYLFALRFQTVTARHELECVLWYV